MNFDSYYNALPNTIIGDIYEKIRENTGEQGPAGPQGPQGATGPQGPQGPAGTGANYDDSDILNRLTIIEDEQIESLKESVWPFIQSNYQNAYYINLPQLVLPILNFVVPNNTITESDYKAFRKLPKSIFYDGSFIQGAGGITGLNYENMLGDYQYYLKYKDCGEQQYYYGFPSKLTKTNYDNDIEVDFMVWGDDSDVTPHDIYAFDLIKTDEEFKAHLRNIGIRTKTGITNNIVTYKQIYVDWENGLYTNI
jgi:hypothetical protein